MKTRIVGLALLLLGCSTALHADPIAITSGQFTITNSLTGAGPMMLSSDRFNIGMFVFSSASPSGFCFTCIPGQNIDFSLRARSEEHTSELQSRGHLVCRLLL